MSRIKTQMRIANFLRGLAGHLGKFCSVRRIHDVISAQTRGCRAEAVPGGLKRKVDDNRGFSVGRIPW